MFGIKSIYFNIKALNNKLFLLFFFNFCSIPICHTYYVCEMDKTAHAVVTFSYTHLCTLVRSNNTKYLNILNFNYIFPTHRKFGSKTVEELLIYINNRHSLKYLKVKRLPFYPFGETRSCDHSIISSSSCFFKTFFFHIIL